MKKIKLFALLLFSSIIVSAQNITKIEYWVDVDSGFGNGIDISGFPQSANVINYLYTIPATVTNGVHTIGIRSKDANDVWSHSNFFTVLVNDTSTAGAIEALEYFWDVDSGFYYYVPYIPSSLLTDLSNEIVNVPVPINLSVGSHMLFVRSRDSNGKWSHTNYPQNITVDTLGTGLTELNEFGINIYPNPFADEITVTHKGNQKMRLILYNESGQLAMDKVIEQSTQINTQLLAPGTYTVFIWVEKQKIYRSIIIKL